MIEVLQIQFVCCFHEPINIYFCLMQQPLFPQDENITSPSEKVIRIKNLSASLSKEQQTFNRLVKRIESLQRQLEEDTAKMEELTKFYHQEITPRVIELSSLKIQLCHLLDAKQRNVKISHIRNGKLDDLIMDFLDAERGRTR